MICGNTVNSPLVSWAEYWVTVSLIQVSNSMQQAEAKKKLFPQKTKENKKMREDGNFAGATT